MDLPFTLPPFMIGRSNLWLQNGQILPGSALVINSIYSGPFFLQREKKPAPAQMPAVRQTPPSLHLRGGMPPALYRHPDQPDQRLVCEGFAQEPDGPGPHGLFLDPLGVVRGHEDHRHVQPGGVQAIEDLQAGHPRHLHVDHRTVCVGSLPRPRGTRPRTRTCAPACPRSAAGASGRGPPTGRRRRCGSWGEGSPIGFGPRAGGCRERR